jgi:hypothetical protein
MSHVEGVPVVPAPATPDPVITPNVVVSNPVTRRVVNNVLGYAGTAVSIAVIVDSAIPQIDISAFTVPAITIIAGIAGLFNLIVTVPNIPKK